MWEFITVILGVGWRVIRENLSQVRTQRGKKKSGGQYRGWATAIDN